MLYLLDMLCGALGAGQYAAGLARQKELSLPNLDFLLEGGRVPSVARDCPPLPPTRAAAQWASTAVLRDLLGQVYQGFLPESQGLEG
jgi:hypothetical protein